MCPTLLKCSFLTGLEAPTLLFGWFLCVTLLSWNSSISDQAGIKRSACLFLREIKGVLCLWATTPREALAGSYVTIHCLTCRSSERALRIEIETKE